MSAARVHTNSPLRLVPAPVEANDRPDRYDDEEHLVELLRRAARKDLTAFMDFYDATCHFVWRLEQRRWHGAELTEVATRRRFAVAWASAASQPGSGLSPLAWLLSLPTRALEPA